MTLPKASYLRLQKDGSVWVDVHVTPNAARTQIQGLHDGALKVRLQAPPVEGKANLALEAWLAELLAVPKSAVTLLRGGASRRKQLSVASGYASAAHWDQLAPQD